MSEENETSTDNTPDPVRKTTKYVLIVVAILFIWYVVSDRIAPWTDQARVQAYVIPMVPQVSGRVVEVNVVKDQVVEPGYELLNINPDDAAHLGLKDNEMVNVLSRRGKVKVRTKVTDTCPPGVVSMTFHFHESPTNVLTNCAIDPVAKIPETKVCAVKIEKREI